MPDSFLRQISGTQPFRETEATADGYRLRDQLGDAQKTLGVQYDASLEQRARGLLDGLDRTRGALVERSGHALQVQLDGTRSWLGERLRDAETAASAVGSAVTAATTPAPVTAPPPQTLGSLFGDSSIGAPDVWPEGAAEQTDALGGARQTTLPTPDVLAPPPSDYALEHGTPEGERITSALAKTATEQTPGGSFVRDVSKQVLDPSGALGDANAGPAAKALGLGATALSAAMAPAALIGALGEQGARRAPLPSGEVIPGAEWSKPSAFLPFLIGAALPSPDDVARLAARGAPAAGAAAGDVLGALSPAGRAEFESLIGNLLEAGAKTREEAQFQAEHLTRQVIESGKARPEWLTRADDLPIRTPDAPTSAVAEAAPAPAARSLDEAAEEATAQLPPPLVATAQRAAREATKDAPAQAGVVEKFMAVTLNNLFTPGTVGINIASNLVQTVARPVQELLEARPVTAWKDITAMARAVPGAASRAGRVWVGGRNAVPGDVAETMVGAYGRPEAFPGKTGMVATAVMRGNQALDEFFRGVNTAGAAAVAQAKGMTPEEAAPFIAKAAATSVFQGPPSRITRGITDMGRATEGNPALNLAWMAGVYTFFPFIRVQEQLFKQAVAIGVAPVVQIGRMLEAGAKRDPDAFREAAAKWMLGTATWGIATGAANAGALTGVGTGSWQEESLARNARDAEGKPIRQPEAINFGGRWVPSDFFGPWGMAASVMASAVEGFNEPAARGKPAPEFGARLWNGVNNAGRQLDRQFYLSDFVKFAGAVGQGRGLEEASRIGSGLVKRAAPGIVRPVTEGLDTTVREPTNALETILAALPGLSKSVPPKIDPTTGKDVQRTQDALSVLLRSPAPGESNPVAAEVARLEQLGQNISVKQFGREVEYAGEKQSPAQRSALQRAYGQATAAYVLDLLERDDYRQAPDERKAQMLNRALDTAYRAADVTLGDTVARAPAQKAALAWAQTPQYEGIPTSAKPEEIAEQNLAISVARSLLEDYRRRYGKDEGEYRLYQEQLDVWRLASRKPIDADYLKIKRAEVDRRFGVTTQARAAPVPVLSRTASAAPTATPRIAAIARGTGDQFGAVGAVGAVGAGAR